MSVIRVCRCPDRSTARSGSVRCIILTVIGCGGFEGMRPACGAYHFIRRESTLHVLHSTQSTSSASRIAVGRKRTDISWSPPPHHPPHPTPPHPSFSAWKLHDVDLCMMSARCTPITHDSRPLADDQVNQLLNYPIPPPVANTTCRKRLVSADSLGMMAVWDVFPVSRRLQVVRGHSDSVQVRTMTISAQGGAETTVAVKRNLPTFVLTAHLRCSFSPTVHVSKASLPYLDGLHTQVSARVSHVPLTAKPAFVGQNLGFNLDGWGRAAGERRFGRQRDGVVNVGRG